MATEGARCSRGRRALDRCCDRVRARGPRRVARRRASAGFPAVHRPPHRLSDLGLLLGGAFAIAVVSLTDTISTASSFAARSGDEVDGTREMIGIGAANIAAGFFQGFPVSTSGSRTAVAEQAGAKTQVTGLVGAAAITVILVAVPGLLRRSATTDTRRGRDRGVAVSGGPPGDTAALRGAQDRVHAEHGARSSVSCCSASSLDRDRDRALDRQRLSPGVVALSDRSRSRARPLRVSRHP